MEQPPVRVVHKVGFAAGVKCPTLSAGFRKARRSVDYSQGTTSGLVFVPGRNSDPTSETGLIGPSQTYKHLVDDGPAVRVAGTLKLSRQWIINQPPPRSAPSP